MVISLFNLICFLFAVDGDGIGVPDMTMISDIDEVRINNNLRVRYTRDLIYVSFNITYGKKSRVIVYVK